MTPPLSVETDELTGATTTHGTTHGHDGRLHSPERLVDASSPDRRPA